MALQNKFISRDDLLAAFAVWVADRSRPLGRILADCGALDDSRRTLLEALVAEHVKQHGGDTEASLAAVSSLGSLSDDLKLLGDPDLQGRLAATATRPAMPDAGATASYAPSSRQAGERFRILRFHREGGLGRVYVARDEELGREVALKEIRPDKVHEGDLRGRFVLEAEINGGLEHPGIVPVYGLGTYGDGRPFYAMRFVEGDSLKEAIEAYHQAHPQPDGSAVEFRKLLSRFIDVCDAIAFAHSKGVLHRDLKPHNVMLGRFGETLLIDWGLAKAIGRSEPAGPDGSGEATLVPPSGSGHSPTLGVLGSPRYMSPEQAAGAVESLGPATDVFGLGAILFALLTGEPPVQEGAIEDVLDRARRGVIRFPRSLNPNIPRAMEAICVKALAAEPKGRYPSARALAEDIERWLADEPVAVWSEPWPARLARWGRRHRPLMATALAILGTGTIGLAAGLAVVNAEKNRTELARQAEAKERGRAEAGEKEARDKEEEARAVLGFVTNKILAAARPEGQGGGMGIDVTLRKALEATLPRVESTFQGQPLVEASVRTTLAESFLFPGRCRDCRAAVSDRRASSTHLTAAQKTPRYTCEHERSRIGLLRLGSVRRGAGATRADAGTTESKAGPRPPRYAHEHEQSCPNVWQPRP